MATAEALRHTSLGQYWPADSPVHRLDPRAKLLAVGLLTVAVVMATRWSATLLLTLAVLVAAGIARLPVAVLLRAIRPVLPVLLVLALFQVLFGYEPAGVPGAGRHLLAIGSWTLSLGRLTGAAISVLRLASLVLLVALLTSTTTTTALSSGLEMILRPLNRIGLPGHELALVGAIALRFMPILGEELEAVQQAQMARDVSGVAENRWQIARNARRVASLIVPLFADAYRRVDEMTTAMLARCYQGGRGRTYMKEFRLQQRDYVALAISVALLLAATII